MERHQPLNGSRDGTPAQADLCGVPRAAGVRLERRTVDGVTHDLHGTTPTLAEARGAQQMATDALTRAFGAAR